MGFPFLSDLERWINEHGSATILKERLSLCREQLELAYQDVAKKDAKIAELETKLAQLENQLQEQEQQLAPYKMAEHFFEKRGAAFKRLPDGSFSDTVHCPICKIAASAFRPGASGQWVCTRCSWTAAFNVGETSGVLASLRV